MDNRNSKYVSMREAARMLDISYSAFRASFLRGHFPFKLVRVTAYRNKFRRVDVEKYARSLEPEKIVTLPEGAMRVGSHPICRKQERLRSLDLQANESGSLPLV